MREQEQASGRPRLYKQFLKVTRTNHYSRRTEKTCWYWIVFFIRFHGTRHPLELDERHVSEFLSYLAIQRNVAVNTQKIALNALAFLYRRVLERPMGELHGIQHSSRPRRLPVVFSHEEAMRIIGHLPQPHGLAASLMYGE